MEQPDAIDTAYDADADLIAGRTGCMILKLRRTRILKKTMARGKKSICTLQKSIDTEADGDVTETWVDVVTFRAVFTPISLSEGLFTDKQTVTATHLLSFSESQIGSYGDELIEKNRIKIGSMLYDIEAVYDYTHLRPAHYEMALLVRE